MATDPSRRRFIKQEIISGPLSFIRKTVQSFNEGAGETRSKDYFNSFDYCHPLISEAGDLLLEEAVKQGIETRGRSRSDIARELFTS